LYSAGKINIIQQKFMLANLRIIATRFPIFQIIPTIHNLFHYTTGMHQIPAVL